MRCSVCPKCNLAKTCGPVMKWKHSCLQKHIIKSTDMEIAFSRTWLKLHCGWNNCLRRWQCLCTYPPIERPICTLRHFSTAPMTLQLKTDKCDGSTEMHWCGSSVPQSGNQCEWDRALCVKPHFGKIIRCSAQRVLSYYLVFRIWSSCIYKI